LSSSAAQTALGIAFFHIACCLFSHAASLSVIVARKQQHFLDTPTEFAWHFDESDASASDH
jgi:hypothetical protein